MKTFTNKKELKELDACLSGYKTFVEAHKDNNAKLSQCLESNGWDDVWWLISESFDQFSDQQKVDLRLLGCEYALSSIDNFEKEFPEDKRPRLAIEASIAFAKGEITQGELEAAGSAAGSAWSAAGSAAGSAAWSAARSAAGSAWSAAGSAAGSAGSAAESAARSAAWPARSARSAAESAERSAARSAAIKSNTKMLMDLFLRWESE